MKSLYLRYLGLPIFSRIFLYEVIPMMNPDGVYLGNYRGSLLGIDLNRIWDNSSQHAHPTVHAIKTIIDGMATSV